ncbi:PEP-CTERM sorting domain-containing protein [Thalassotalea sp. 1_MG-2023]|uniref:PEP-CTERM sorting domain-containing protein n=1 Tax=Thalassotalea sp. 1_MG-2023 TaxID=3062680 RepID=UPI0026E38D20|nr:PEP-CTERM sorting domain-containing protein [Thalassotalea sp. 1_MG-2023]MDO6426693.1 PEP-CTERM sorting domain-containing protein [Thalassotalea sp. 1_MG-2023]
MKLKYFKTTIAGLAMAISGVANAGLLYDQNLVNGVHFGSGNQNGAFTTETNNGIEIGIRGKLRFDENNSPQPIYNSNGDGTYSFDNVAPPSGFGWAPGATTTSIWSWDWSIDVSGSQYSFGDLTYLMEIDFDPSSATNFLSFDPINSPNDNSISGASQQNSWNMEFFRGALPYNNTDVGIYTIQLSAFDGSTLLASSSIDIIQGVDIPEPSTIAIFALGVIGLASRRFKKLS